jgi:small conductance mechanosensitive channel
MSKPVRRLRRKLPGQRVMTVTRLLANCSIAVAALTAHATSVAGASVNATPPTALEPSKPPSVAPRNTSPPAPKVDVAPLARDDEIQQRLTKILKVAGLFEEPKVDVKDGVVFLGGRTALDANRKWAEDLARNTEDVVAVVNHVDVTRASLWDFGPAIDSVRQMEINLVRSLPLMACGIVILVLAYAAALVATRWMRKVLDRRIYAPLLREVFARCAGLLVVVVGLYVTLRIANLTHLALTIVGGTGLLGLVLGIAFGNITENFLASILLSMQQPFRVGDLVQIAETLGYVQRLTTRTTIIATVEGNEVQIPNATIYKSVIRNYSTIPNCRVDFRVSVPRANVDEAQQRAMDVLTHHPAILKEPEPAVLVDGIDEATVALRAYFWINGQENSRLKVRSSVMRLVLHAIDAPEERARAADGARSRRRANGKASSMRSLHGHADSAKAGAVVTKAEGDLATEAHEIKGQAQEARRDAGENLLRPATGGDNGKSDP